VLCSGVSLQSRITQCRGGLTLGFAMHLVLCSFVMCCLLQVHGTLLKVPTVIAAMLEQHQTPTVDLCESLGRSVAPFWTIDLQLLVLSHTPYKCNGWQFHMQYSYFWWWIVSGILYLMCSITNITIIIIIIITSYYYYYYYY